MSHQVNKLEEIKEQDQDWDINRKDSQAAMSSDAGTQIFRSEEKSGSDVTEMMFRKDDEQSQPSRESNAIIDKDIMEFFQAKL